MSVNDMRSWLLQTIATLLARTPSSISLWLPFASYHLAPQALLEALEARFGRTLPPTLVYDYPTIALLADYLATQDTYLAPDPLSAPVHSHDADSFALIGMACRFPGAPSLAAFWRLLCAGQDAITPIPPTRSLLYREGAVAHIPPWGGFLSDIDRFDAGFFGISPREATQMDPQQRLLLEVAWDALDDAGLVPSTLTERLVSVVVGAWASDYGHFQLQQHAQIEGHTSTGSSLSSLANRLSYTFNLHGESMTVDTGTSSSLIAIHTACRSLSAGDTDIALAGGCNLLLSPALSVALQRAGVLAPDGRCKAFDARANGFVRSEGVGVVVLKRLRDAHQAGDRVYAIIRGSAVHQDGRTQGLMAPSEAAQCALLRRAYARAGVVPAQVDYIEAHGTGTAVGDPIEAAAIGRVLGLGRSPTTPCSLGSVKTNIGHLEAAAGVAGVIKVALMLYHRTLVPTLHVEHPNPAIAFDAFALRVHQTLDVIVQDTIIVAIDAIDTIGVANRKIKVTITIYIAPRDAIRIVILV